MHAKVDAIARKWDPRFSKAAAKAFWHDKRELVKRMQVKAVEWTVIGRKWDEYFEDFADESWREEFMPLVEGLVAEQGESWDAMLGMRFDVRNWLAEAWLEDYMLVFAQDINDTTKKDVSSILLDAMQQGWGIGQMSDGLGLLFNKYINDKGVDCSREDLSQEERWFCDRQPRYRRDSISRTETMRASNSGSQALFGAMGAEKREWWATSDDRTRDSHLAAWQAYSEGGSPGPIPMGQPFIVGGARLMQPGDPAGPPGETIQCRCTVLPFMDAWAGTEAEVAAARADMDAEVARREAEAEREGGG
jgi:uncharacterized protein with gpF-like domain